MDQTDQDRTERGGTGPAGRWRGRLLLLCLLLGGACPAWAQREAALWYFGQQAGFDFRSGSLQVLSGSRMSTIYPTAVLSDPATGQLLFYSNSEQVYNRQHQLMANGDSLRGSLTATQGALIVPDPGSAQRYYLFTLTNPAGLFQPVASYATTLSSSIVDLRRQQGLGEVVPETKNRFVGAGLTEKLTAVRHANGRDYWLITHEWQSAAFRVYPLTATGIGPPARYELGARLPERDETPNVQDQTAGYLQASPDGRHLAHAHFGGRHPFGLFDFDPATGVIANYVNLGVLLDAFGVCFSPDNSKLYVQNFTRVPNQGGFNLISQYDLRAGDGAAIASSGQSIVAGNPSSNLRATRSDATFYALQNAPDGRMYGASGYLAGEDPRDAERVFYVIAQPNERGFACQINFQRFDFGEQAAAGPGLPNFMQHYFNGLEPSSPAGEGDECDVATAQVYPNPARTAFQVGLPTGCPLAYELTLYDALGRRVRQQSVTAPGESAPVAIGELAAGLYLVELRFAPAGQRVVRKLLKH